MGRLWTDADRAVWDEFMGGTAAFCDRYDASPNAIARLIKDAMVAAYVRGAMHGQYQTGPLKVPTDMEMLRQARETAEMMPESYPALAWLERGRDAASEEGGDDD